MADFDVALVANVTEAGDIVLLALALAIACVVGLALYWIDVGVGRLRRGAGEELEGPSPETRRRG